MFGVLWRRGFQHCMGMRNSSSFPMLKTGVRPLEELGLDAEDFIKLYNRAEASRGEDPLEFLTSKKTMLKVQRNMDLLEYLGMSARERKAMVMGTDRIFETTPDVLQKQIEFYKRKLDFSEAEVCRFFVSYPDIIHQSLGNHIAQRVGIYRVLGLKRKSVKRMVLLYPQLLTLKLDDHLLPAMRVVAKAHFSWEQGKSLLKYFPELVGIPREELKIVFHVLKRDGLSTTDIVNMYRKIAKARFHAPAKYGEKLPEVLWTRFRKESGEKLGVIVMRDVMMWGRSFRKEQIKEKMESRKKNWRPVWDFLETKRSEIRPRGDISVGAMKEISSEVNPSIEMESDGCEKGASSDETLRDAINDVISEAVHDGERDGENSDSDDELDDEAEEGNLRFSEAFTTQSIEDVRTSDHQDPRNQNRYQHQQGDEVDVGSRIKMVFKENVTEPEFLDDANQDIHIHEVERRETDEEMQRPKGRFLP